MTWHIYSEKIFIRFKKTRFCIIHEWHTSQTWIERCDQLGQYWELNINSSFEIVEHLIHTLNSTVTFRFIFNDTIFFFLAESGLSIIKQWPYSWISCLTRTYSSKYLPIAYYSIVAVDMFDFSIIVYCLYRPMTKLKSITNNIFFWFEERFVYTINSVFFSVVLIVSN